MKPFLAQATLANVSQEVARPSYDRDAVTNGVVHFGPGAFHRVHQAWFFENLLAKDPRWGITAVSLRNPDVRNALVPQDGLYTLVTFDEKLSYQVIGAIKDVLVAPENPEAVLRALCSEHTHLVTMTVTEKGYCLGAEGQLDLAHPDIQADTQSPNAPVSVIGFLVEALARRRAGSLPPITIISCDNLVDNGAKLGNAVIRLAETRDADLASWIRDTIRFPRTMIDSITPATTDAVRENVQAALGVQDRWPVQREEFCQWVIEDHFSGVVPDWASVGVTVTDDVGSYDRAKLRLLNGAHSTLAYTGLLSGHETVAEAVTDPDLLRFVRAMMVDDIRPTLTVPPGLDIAAYIESILKRFRNPAIRHALSQIAWDGSQKLPFRILGTISDNLAAGRRIDRLCVPLAAWMHFIRIHSREGTRVNDPLAERLYEIGVECINEPQADVPRFLRLETVFPVALGAEPLFRSALMDAYELWG